MLLSSGDRGNFGNEGGAKRGETNQKIPTKEKYVLKKTVT